MKWNRIVCGNAMELAQDLLAHSVHCVVTSPPYWGGMRDYGVGPTAWGGRADCKHSFTADVEGGGPRAAGARPQKVSTGSFCVHCGAWLGVLGNEPDPDLYVRHLVDISTYIYPALHPQGTLFLNINDTRIERQWAAVPERLVLAMIAAGWRYEDSVIWRKDNNTPGSHTNRTVRCHEQVLVFNKSRGAYWDAFAIREKSESPECQRRIKELQKGMIDGTFNLRGPGRDGQNPPSMTGALYSRQARIDSSITGLRNRRSVWDISAQPFLYEMCLECRKVYMSAVHRKLDHNDDGKAICQCGASNWFTHLATFPDELAKLCIMAGTSEKGACPECGAPWNRQVEKLFVKLSDRSKTRRYAGLRDKQHKKGTRDVNSENAMGYNELTHLGWGPGCRCAGNDPVPCVVLDLFAGSGTTLRNAQKLGRCYYGIELSPDAVDLARQIQQIEAGQGNLTLV